MSPSVPRSRSEEEFDDRLAAFADQVIAGKIEVLACDRAAALPEEKKESALGDASEGEVEEGELADLEETIVRLNRAVKAARPDESAAARIEAPLKAGWKTSTRTQSGFFNRLDWSVLLGPGMGFPLVVGVVVLVLLAAGLLLQQPGTDSLPGAAVAEGNPSSFWMLLALGAVLVVAWYFFRKGRS